MKRVILSLAIVGLVASGAYAVDAVQPAPIAHFNVVGDSVRDLTLPPIYLEDTLGTSYFPTLGNYGDDLHTTYSAHPLVTNPIAVSNINLEGYDLGWYSADTDAGHGDHSFTVNFYANDPDDSTIDLTAPLFTHTFTEAGGAGVTGIRNTVVEFDNPVMNLPADLWMYVQFDAAHPKTGMLIAADWPVNPFGAPSPTGSGAEYGFSHWWFITATPGLTYFGPYVAAGDPPGNFLMSLYGTPEPATIGLLAMGGLALLRRRR